MSSQLLVHEEGDTIRTESREEATHLDLPLNVVFHILSNQRRRHTLRYLNSQAATTTLSDLSSHIASLETDKPEAAVTSTERKRVYVGLYQCHLPKMADAGVIAFDKDRKTIELTESADQVLRFLPESEEIGRSKAGWTTRFRGDSTGSERFWTEAIKSLR